MFLCSLLCLDTNCGTFFIKKKLLLLQTEKQANDVLPVDPYNHPDACSPPISIHVFLLMLSNFAFPLQLFARNEHPLIVLILKDHLCVGFSCAETERSAVFQRSFISALKKRRNHTRHDDGNSFAVFKPKQVLCITVMS